MHSTLICTGTHTHTHTHKSHTHTHTYCYFDSCAHLIFKNWVDIIDSVESGNFGLTFLKFICLKLTSTPSPTLSTSKENLPFK